MSSAGYSLGVNVEYTYDVDEKEIDKMVRAVDRKYGLMESDDVKRHYVVGLVYKKQQVKKQNNQLVKS